MVAERFVTSLRSLHGWKHWAAEWLGWITETWSNDRALLVEVTDVADVQVRKPDIRVDNDVGGVTTAPVLTELSRSFFLCVFLCFFVRLFFCFFFFFGKCFCSIPFLCVFLFCVVFLRALFCVFSLLKFLCLCAALLLPRRPPTYCCSRAVAGRNDEVRKIDASHCRRQ